jgi:hypothetical protein
MSILKQKIIQGILSLFLASLLWNCAQYVAPTGGKKDEKPPALVKSNPENKQTNFKGKEIELTFDELIDVASLRQELLIIPEIEGFYDIKPKTKSVLLKFDKPFKDNTTFTFNFRKGIKDLSEKNDAQNLKLVFSTGKDIDSLSIEGNVKQLFTNQPILDVLVGIYQLTDTLNFRKIKPNYFTKTDSSGNFKFENIQSSNYRLYAFTDKNNNLKFDPKTEMIGFLKDTLRLTKNISSVDIKLYNANQDKPKNQKTLQRVDDYTVIYDKNIQSFHVKFENPKDSIPYIGDLNELKFYNFPTKTDTIKVEITVRDSANNELIHSQKIKFREAEKKKKTKEENFNFTINKKNGSEIEAKTKFELKFLMPISVFNIEKIKIISDTITNENIQTNDFLWNKYRNNVQFTKTVSAKREVKINFEKGCVINLKGDSSSAVVVNYKILNPDNYGIIEGKVEGKQEQKIVQLIDENYTVEKEEITSEKFIFKNIKPNIYIFRTIIDLNKNGRWDFGDVEKGILPEPIFFSENPIKIKANFELKDLLIKIPKP